jgi:hypothetical protein
VRVVPNTALPREHATGAGAQVAAYLGAADAAPHSNHHIVAASNHDVIAKHRDGLHLHHEKV